MNEKLGDFTNIRLIVDKYATESQSGSGNNFPQYASIKGQDVDFRQGNQVEQDLNKEGKFKNKNLN